MLMLKSYTNSDEPTPMKVVISDPLNGERIDRALAVMFPDRSRSNLARLIELGHVRIDSHPVSRASERVRAGQTVEITFPPPAPATIESQDLPLTVLHEDDDIVLVDQLDTEAQIGTFFEVPVLDFDLDRG